MSDATNANSPIKKRGLGRGLDALFGEAKQQYDSNLTGTQTASPRAPVSGGMPAAGSSGAGGASAAAVTANVQTGNLQTGADGDLAPALRSGDGGVKRVPITQLVSGKYQPRKTFDENAIEQLRDSIEVHGILQPILVRAIGGGKFEIIAGERRWRAAQRVPMHDVPVIIQNLDDKQTLEIALIENLQRADLSPLEESEGYQRLIDEFNYSHDDLATKIGKSRPHVANMLRLLKLPQSVKKFVHSGEISAGHARALLGAKDAEHLAAKIVKQGLSVRAVEKIIKREHEDSAAADVHKKDPNRAKTAKDDINIREAEKLVSNATGMRVKIEAREGSGRITLEYDSLDQFDMLMEKLSG